MCIAKICVLVIGKCNVWGGFPILTLRTSISPAPADPTGNSTETRQSVAPTGKENIVFISTAL